MKTTTTLYDVAEHLRTPEVTAAYLGNIARAQGMTLVGPWAEVEFQCVKGGRGDLSSAEVV
jgi:DNA-binding phage protein